MRKVLIPLFSFLVFFLAVPLASAQQTEPGSVDSVPPVEDGVTEKMIAPRPPGDNLNFLGQDNSYSVTFRGNGEAVVTYRSIFSNTGNQPLTTVFLKVPRVNPNDLVVYQVIRESQCIRYYDEPLDYPIKKPVTPNCVEYQEPDYYQYWGSSKYQKADVEVKGDILDVTLPKAIDSNRSGSFVLYFRAFGYAKKDLFGKYDYVFETLKVNDRIRNLQVGIDTDSDLVIKGGMGKVDYGYPRVMENLKSADSFSGAITSPQFDQFYQEIGQGQIYKSASNLQSMESYIVKGSYGDAMWKLYAKDILLTVLIGSVVVVVFLVLVKLIVGRLQSKSHSPIMAILEVGGLSFVTSLLVLLYTLFLMFVVNNSYRVDNPDYGGFLFVLTVIVSIGVYLLLLLLPSVLVGLRRGWKYGVGTFITTVLLLLFYLMVLFFVFFLFGETINSFQIMPDRGAPIKTLKLESPPANIQ